MYLVAILHDGTPNPRAPEQSHDEYVREPGALVQSEPLPVEKAAEEEIGGDLRQGGYQGCQGTRTHAEVKGKVRASVGKEEGCVEEEGEPWICIMSVLAGFQWRVERELFYSHKEEVFADEDLENFLDLADRADPLCCFDFLSIGTLDFLGGR